jgi:hypothetical protein
MTQTVKATSGGEDFEIELDLETRNWHATAVPPEGEFPLIVHADDKRFEVYSDGTFAEVES